MRNLMFMSLAASFAAMFAFGFAGKAASSNDPAYRVSGPFVHENLAIYLVHGKVDSGPVPLTLEEALAKGAVRVDETGSVNELAIENLSAEEVFVQAGDIVKGGKQDRVITSSLVLPPRSGRVPLASFCVEQGRWTARGAEDALRFASSPSAVPSRAAKIAMRAPLAASPNPQSDSVAVRQVKVWQSVAETQARLSTNLGAPVAAPQSRSSLQLSLENEKLAAARAAYVKALTAAGEKEQDVVGYVFAVNGKLNSADIYPSNGLFRKMWTKLLTASATEAIGEKDAKAETPPAKEAVLAFLDEAERGKATVKKIDGRVRLETREAAGALYFEAASPSGAWVHRNYLAR
jgi:hypothetical protein